jgi:chromatin assembly factor 1 subunit B
MHTHIHTHIHTRMRTHPGPAATWKTCGALRGHADDVHDLAWSPDGSALVSGGVENICILWDVDAKRGMVGPVWC